MSNRKPKTEGLEWLIHSLGAFNGSGYADMNGPQDFFDSYIAYKTMRKKPQAVALARMYRQEALSFLESLLARTYGARRVPSEKSLEKFERFRGKEQAKLL